MLAACPDLPRPRRSLRPLPIFTPSAAFARNARPLGTKQVRPDSRRCLRGWQAIDWQARMVDIKIRVAGHADALRDRVNEKIGDASRYSTSLPASCDVVLSR